MKYRIQKKDHKWVIVDENEKIIGKEYSLKRFAIRKLFHLERTEIRNGK